MTEFDALGLSPTILKTVATLGFSAPTPIQKQAIPLVLQGRDLMGLAQTGTGKTAAFGLPLIQNLLDEKTRPEAKSIRALILAPTRELASQISDNLRSYIKGTQLRVHVITGGASINVQCRKLAPGTDILVATPGRLLDLVDRGALKLNHTSYLVLDEADQMLDLGFIHALRKIAKLLGSKRQTLLFSATMPKQIEDLSRTYLNDPVRVETAPAGRAADKIDQSVHFLPQGSKSALLKECLSVRQEDISLVFARTKHGAEKLMKYLVSHGFKAGSIHGNKTQGQRERAIRAFKGGDLSILVATDVAARGIDIPGVSHVYNFNLPEVPENYIHRIGRTARAGADGKAVAFCAPDELHLLKAIEKLMGKEVTIASGERGEETGGKTSRHQKKAPPRKRPNRQRTKPKNAAAHKPGERPVNRSDTSITNHEGNTTPSAKHKPKQKASQSKDGHRKGAHGNHAASRHKSQHTSTRRSLAV